MKRKALAVVMAAICSVLVLACPAFAMTPNQYESAREADVLKAIENLDKPFEGKIVRIDAPDENGNWVTYEGNAAQKHYEESVAETRKYLLAELSSLKTATSDANDTSTTDNTILRGPFSYKYRYVETSHTDNVSRTDLTKNVTNKLSNLSSVQQSYDLRLSVSQSWSISPQVSTEFEKAVKLQLGGSWGKTYTREETLHVNIAPHKTVQVKFYPIMERSVGNAQKYYIPRGSLNNRPVIAQSIQVTTYNPKYTTCSVKGHTFQSVYGEYIWVES